MSEGLNGERLRRANGGAALVTLAMAAYLSLQTARFNYGLAEPWVTFWAVGFACCGILSAAGWGLSRRLGSRNYLDSVTAAQVGLLLGAFPPGLLFGFVMLQTFG